MTLESAEILNFALYKWRNRNGEITVELTTEEATNVILRRCGEARSEKKIRMDIKALSDFIHIGTKNKKRVFWITATDKEKLTEYCAKTGMKVTYEIKDTVSDMVCVDEEPDDDDEKKYTQEELNRMEFLFDATVRRFCGKYYEQYHRKLDTARIIAETRAFGMKGYQIRSFLEGLTATELLEYCV